MNQTKNYCARCSRTDRVQAAASVWRRSLYWVCVCIYIYSSQRYNPYSVCVRTASSPQQMFSSSWHQLDRCPLSLVICPRSAIASWRHWDDRHEYRHLLPAYVSRRWPIRHHASVVRARMRTDSMFSAACTHPRRQHERDTYRRNEWTRADNRSVKSIRSSLVCAIKCAFQGTKQLAGLTKNAR